MVRVAINGGGRIGRAITRLIMERDDVELVAINDLGAIDNIAYLLKYDTVYGSAGFGVSVAENKKSLVLTGPHGPKTVEYISEKNPSSLPWKYLNIDVVVESSGVFTSFKKARAHVDAGARKVVITAPVKDEPQNKTEGTVLLGINEDALKDIIVSSNASCTTNAAAPLIQILSETIGIEKALLSTVHGITASQAITDSAGKKDLREDRAGCYNIVPTSTGAAIAVTKVIKSLDHLFDGISFRVPVIAGSIADITFLAKRDTTKEEINTILTGASSEARWQGIFGITSDPIVSSDIINSRLGSIADLSLTTVVAGNLVRVCAWYDNEMGYTSVLLQHVIKLGSI